MSWDDFTKWLHDYQVPVIIVTCVVMSGVGVIGLRYWLLGPKCKSKASMKNKVVVITGANTGIGKETAKDLAKRGARVIILARDLERAKAAAEDISQDKDVEGMVEVLHIDLADLSSVRHAAHILIEKQPKIDVLINNAGVMMCPQWETKEGFEMHLGTNHLGHFLLTVLLLNNLKAASPSRIVTVSSIAHTRGIMHWDDLNMKESYNPTAAYCQSKLANILFSNHLSKILHGTGVTTYSLHPGVVQTELGRHIGESVNKFIHWSFHFFGKFLFKTVSRGAQTSIYCAVEESIQNQTGLYYSDCAQKKPHPHALDEGAAERLWRISAEMVGLESPV